MLRCQPWGGSSAASLLLTPNGSALTEAEKAAITADPNLSGGGGGVLQHVRRTLFQPAASKILPGNRGAGIPAGIVLRSLAVCRRKKGL